MKPKKKKEDYLMKPKIHKALHVKEGTDETSYAKTSYIQNEILSMTKQIKEEALREFYLREQPRHTICIADMGCGSAEKNTLTLMLELTNTIDKARRDDLNNNGHGHYGPLEYQVYLNDLPGNDFNSLFSSLQNFEAILNDQKMGHDDEFCGNNCFVYGVPGSFYARLFPSNHLHFVHSSYSLHWLSQVPKGIENNKKNIGIGRRSPSNVLKAYYEQFEQDFLSFLRCRSKEVVAGGSMVLTMLGRKTKEIYSNESYYVFDFLATALNDMVNEGLINEEKLNTFNFPVYAPSTTELCFLVEKEGTFTMNQEQVSEVSWETKVNCENNSYKSFDHKDVAKCMRSVTEPFVANHFGEAIIEDLYHRYTEILKVSLAKENINVFTNVTIWLTRKAQSMDTNI